jgi:hypothetical protein
MDLRKDSKGNRPNWYPGNRVWVSRVGEQATVVEQTLDYETHYPEFVWDSVKLQFDNGNTELHPAWQLSRVVT